MDLIIELGELALASRLKRLSERLMRDVSRVYKELDEPFEARWFPLLRALLEESPQGVTQVARALGLTHPAVNQLAGEMARAGLLLAARDRRDERRRLLRLSKRGREVAARLAPVWEEIRRANHELIAETRSTGGHELLDALAATEAALDRRGMHARVTDRLRACEGDRIEILPYRPAWRRHFEALNREWLESLFTVEPADAILLADPHGRIVKPGGEVLFARLDGRVVGTCALIRHEAGAWELAKMAVAPAARGRGIGRRLAEVAIEAARARRAGSLFLETSPRLKAAIGLYESLGFRRVPAGPLGRPKYRRCSITMILDLDGAPAPCPKGPLP
jgi:ribosomal protein S18 acetylase RimI-like enzyme